MQVAVSPCAGHACRYREDVAALGGHHRGRRDPCAAGLQAHRCRSTASSSKRAPGLSGAIAVLPACVTAQRLNCTRPHQPAADSFAALPARGRWKRCRGHPTPRCVQPSTSGDPEEDECRGLGARHQRDAAGGHRRWHLLRPCLRSLPAGTGLALGWGVPQGGPSEPVEHQDTPLVAVSRATTRRGRSRARQQDAWGSLALHRRQALPLVSFWGFVYGNQTTLACLWLTLKTVCELLLAFGIITLNPPGGTFQARL